MIGRNDRSATIYRLPGADRVRVRVTGDHYLQGRKVYPLLKHEKEAVPTSQHQDGGREGRGSSLNHVPFHLMLSAFHARKVRLAAASGVQEPAAPSLTPTDPDLQSPAPGNAPRRSSRKRKPESVTGNVAEQPQRRKKTDDRKHEGNVRYFDAPVVLPEPDSPLLTDDDVSLSDQELLSQPHVRPRRAWSPSQPLLDSSDEELESEVSDIQTTNTSIAAPTTAPFSAEIDTNTFRLTPKECFALISLEEPAAAMILPAHSNVTFTGVYQLTVLQGAVMVMGVTLVSSNVSHPVFSPKISPLPRVESLGNTGPASPLINRVPDRLRPWIPNDHAVVLICAHPTGIEGLGHIMRVFEGMFQPFRLSDSTVDLGIPGVRIHTVCISLGL